MVQSKAVTVEEYMTLDVIGKIVASTSPTELIAHQEALHPRSGAAAR